MGSLMSLDAYQEGPLIDGKATRNSLRLNEEQKTRAPLSPRHPSPSNHINADSFYLKR